MNFDNWAYHPNKLPTHFREKQAVLDELEKAFVDELSSRSDVQAWLQGYEEKSRIDFLKYHARWKRNFVQYFVHHYEKMTAAQELRFREYSEYCLQAIQQKKLFNLQLQWRAEEISLPGIQLCCQFDDWQSHVMDCPFLEPPSADEVELMQRFLTTSEGEAFLENKGYFHSWQNVDQLLDRRPTARLWEDTYPDWYNYYDLHYGTRRLLALPDIRYEKELYYIRLGRENRQADSTPPTPPPAVTPYLPPLNYLAYKDKFAAQFEDKWFQALFAANKEAEDQEHDEEKGHDVDEYLRILRLCPHPVAMPALTDWRMALKQCAYGSLAQQVADELEEVAAEHALLRELSVATPSDSKQRWHQSMFEHYAKAILDGREAAGEPRTLDF